MAPLEEAGKEPVRAAEGKESAPLQGVAHDPRIVETEPVRGLVNGGETFVNPGGGRGKGVVET